MTTHSIVSIPKKSEIKIAKGSASKLNAGLTSPIGLKTTSFAELVARSKESNISRGSKNVSLAELVSTINTQSQKSGIP